MKVDEQANVKDNQSVYRRRENSKEIVPVNIDEEPKNNELEVKKDNQ